MTCEVEMEISERPGLGRLKGIHSLIRRVGKWGLIVLDEDTMASSALPHLVSAYPPRVRGCAHAEAGRATGAIKHLRRVLEWDADDAQACLRLRMIY